MSEEKVINYEFKAEVQKVLQIITHSLYTNREIFLREIISNSSDALDKLRFAKSAEIEVRDPDLPLEIKITIEKENKKLIISDTGIGMTKEELIENLGTIAKSGSENFLANMAKQSPEAKTEDASQIIGRFGVGLYSIFMVADKVEITSLSKDMDAQAYTWTSDGLGYFTVERAENSEQKRGTTIVAYMKEDATDFLEKYRVESVIRKHSSFISFPILLDGEKINTTPALWREPKFSVTKEQYNEFYKFISYDAKDPLEVIHYSIDAPVQFNSLIFIPREKNDFFSSSRDTWGLDLYANRVLIQKENKELIPEYLGFAKGVVDTEDLPLNISRETLQENILIRKIQQTIVKHMLGHLEKLAKDDVDRYNEFWQLHGKIFKLGYQDYINRERVAGLLRFNSSTCEKADDLISFEQYMERAKEGQKIFWYVSAQNREAAQLNPHLEVFSRKGIEVLFLYEPIDEFAIEGLGKYKEFSFKSIEHVESDNLEGYADTTEEENKVEPLADDEKENFDNLLLRIKEILGDKIKDVKISHRLASSPACLVSSEGSMTSSMEKLMKIVHKDDTIPQKTLEVNQDHPILRNSLKIFKADPNDIMLAETIQSLFDTSLLLDGYVKDPHTLANRTNKLLEQAGKWYTQIRDL